ncbi:metal-dependent hydrolase [Brevibacillus fluminis]|uniref:metal-dependent hydrolase n=1 Tax=Brevibacillus fluminis TaxID=511487 RepID=UPI0016059A37|nr:metal-dependent hydrolase [Brevibacillus fluminis]
MNKSGHLALGVALGSAYLSLAPLASTLTLVGFGIGVAAVGIGSLAPDIDHKTSTASKVISPFSPQTRRSLKSVAGVLALIGALLLTVFLNRRFGIGIPFEQAVISLPDGLIGSFPFWLAASVFCLLLTKIRDLVLFGVGAFVLYAWYAYQLHWFFAFLGGALFILPLVRHRGVIHTPEFAICLSLGLWSVASSGSAFVYASALGFIIGWWSHLVGDLFGQEGIHSLVVPRLRVALHLFHNGGHMEKLITRFCWICSTAIWVIYVAMKSSQWVIHAVLQFVR